MASAACARETVRFPLPVFELHLGILVPVVPPVVSAVSGTRAGQSARAFQLQGYPSDEPVGSARLVLYRKYSAIVSMPRDHLALVWAPAFPHAEGQFGKLGGRLLNLTWDGIGVWSCAPPAL
jgi:hypothetical protein